MGIRIHNSDPEPMTKRGAGFTLLAAISLTALTFLIPWPVALLTGIPAYICWWCLFGDLFCVYRNVPHSPHAESREARQESMNKGLFFLLIVLPSVLCVLALALLVCYN